MADDVVDRVRLMLSGGLTANWNAVVERGPILPIHENDLRELVAKVEALETQSRKAYQVGYDEGHIAGWDACYDEWLIE